MSVLDDIHEQVGEITASHSLGADFKGFAYWYLEEIEDFGQEEAEDLVVDGAWDSGRDAVHIDDEQRRLTIYQFKYSDNLPYVTGAFTDIQNGVQAEQDKLASIDNLRLVVVTTAKADQDLQRAAKNAQRRIRRWLTVHDFRDVEATVELVDLNHFRQVFETLYGISLTLDFRTPPLAVDGAVVGLVDASVFQEHVGNEALFAFNIRKFLGLRRGSVNWQIKQTLEQDDDREDFWTYNNGIVCLATRVASVPGEAERLDADNFTIVNGAQTVNTVASFLDANPAVTEPVWVLAKIVEVAENDLERARRITRTSNTQTPTSNKDLRAVDLVHRRLERWLADFFDLAYLYRRGVRAPRGVDIIAMKDLLQAYAAFQTERPDMAFSGVGQLFSSDAEYSAAFPSEKADELRNTGTPDEIRAMLVERVLPWRLLAGVRARLAAKVQSGLDKRWKSVAYHVVWLYKRIFKLEGMDQNEELLEQVGDILGETADALLDAFISFCVSRNEEIPRALKTDRLSRELLNSGFFDQPLVLEMRAKLRATVEGGADISP